MCHTFRKVEVDLPVEELVLPRETHARFGVLVERLEAIQRIAKLLADVEQRDRLLCWPGVRGEDADAARYCGSVRVLEEEEDERRIRCAQFACSVNDLVSVLLASASVIIWLHFR